ncbi:MAG: hypothetical protein ACFCGT_11435 [Sandaracinaceae bacterium]
MEAPQAPSADDGAIPSNTVRAHTAFDGAVEVVDERVEIAAKVTVEQGRRSELESEPPGTFGAEVDGRPIDLDEARLPEAEVHAPKRHALGTVDKASSDRVEALVHELLGLRDTVQEPHRVGLPVVEQLPRPIVVLLAEQRVKGAAQIPMEPT